MEIIIAQNASITLTTSAVARPTFAAYSTSSVATTTNTSKSSSITSVVTQTSTTTIQSTTSASIPQTAFWDNTKEFTSFFLIFTGLFLIILSIILIKYRRTNSGFEDSF